LLSVPRRGPPIENDRQLLLINAAVARGQLTPASAQPDGTPHPDPVLAAAGWQVDHGIYQRTGQATSERIADREAV
jgi:hypothetical protein